MKYEIEYIEKIAKIVADNNLSEITLEDGEQAIVIRKENIVAQNSVVAPVQTIAQAPAVASVNVANKEEKQFLIKFVNNLRRNKIYQDFFMKMGCK